MISMNEIQTLLDQNGAVLADGGERIGKIEQVFLDDSTGQPEWVTVKTGMFGSAGTFVPLADASVSGTDIVVPYTRNTVKDAPRVDVDEHLSAEQEAELYRFYGLQYSESFADPGNDGEPVDLESGRDTSGPTTDDAMTRSEERLNVGTRQVATGRAKLRKYVVTENVTQTVPVRREEVRLEREPITDENRGAAVSGGDITEEEHEVTLNEERVTVSKETVPVERVKLGTETVTAEEQVDEEVRREEIELDDSDLPGDRGTR